MTCHARTTPRMQITAGSLLLNTTCSLSPIHPHPGSLSQGLQTVTSSGSGRPSSVEHSPSGLSSPAPESTESSNWLEPYIWRRNCTALHCMPHLACIGRGISGSMSMGSSSGTLNSTRAHGFTDLPGCGSTTTPSVAHLQDSSAGLWPRLATPHSTQVQF